MDLYDLGLAIAGVAALGAAFLPRMLHERALSLPIIYVALGMVMFVFPIDFPQPDPIRFSGPLERLTEMGVIVALMGAGLKVGRPVNWSQWGTTWRLLAITMPLTIGAAWLLGWWIVGLAPATALLFGAVCAPTDPVLASEVQVHRPGKGEGDEVRFGLTSEAGLNDALAFPFTNAALAMAGASAGATGWVLEWFAVDVLYKISVGLVVGIASGKLLAWLLFELPKGRNIERLSEGFVAIAATFIAYGVSELLNSYGFLAVFVAAVSLRNYEREHEYHQTLHDFAEEIERLLTVLLLVLFGGAVATGMLEPLTWEAAAVGVALVLLVRPGAGMIALSGRKEPFRERLTIAFFGIRGIGSLYYLAYGINHGDFPNEELLWALVGLIVLFSVLLHGVTASPVMHRLDARATG